LSPPMTMRRLSAAGLLLNPDQERNSLWCSTSSPDQTLRSAPT
jgi:hypothetical protein